MNRTLLLASAAVLFAANAQALEVTPYVGARISYDFVRSNYVESGTSRDSSYAEKTKFNGKTWGGHLAVGAKAGPFRLETEYNHDRATRKIFNDEEEGQISEFGRTKVNLKTQSLLVNAYYDFNLCSRFTPYVSAGAGLAKLNLRIHDSYWTGKETTSNFAWQIGAGVSYAATDNVDFDLGYRYVDMGAAYLEREATPYYKESEKVNASRHELYAGIRYNF